MYNLVIGSGPKPGQELHAAVQLTNVYRTTGNIFSINVTLKLSKEDLPIKKAIPSPDLHLGHSVEGPSVFLLDLDHYSCKEEAVWVLVTELCGKRGIKPSDIMAVMSGGLDFSKRFSFDIEAMNTGLKLMFCVQGFIPHGVEGAQNFYSSKKEEYFHVGGSPDYKGLEA